MKQEKLTCGGGASQSLQGHLEASQEGDTCEGRQKQQQQSHGYTTQRTQFLGSLNACSTEVLPSASLNSSSEPLQRLGAMREVSHGDKMHQLKRRREGEGRKSFTCYEDDQTASRLTIILPCTSRPHHSHHHPYFHLSMENMDHLTVVTGPPGDDDGVRFGVRLVHKLHFHVVRRLDVMLTDLWVLLAEQIETRPRDTTWGANKRKHSTHCARKSLATPSIQSNVPIVLVSIFPLIPL